MTYQYGETAFWKPRKIIWYLHFELAYKNDSSWEYIYSIFLMRYISKPRIELRL
jgi:hypothetical protein